jgi:two-component system, response regulator YesN
MSEIGLYSLWIVDDEKPVLDLLKRSIPWKHLGIEITAEAGSTEEVIKLLSNSEAPDIMLTDILMPGKNGIELAFHMHRHHPETVVILLTGHERFEFAQKAIEAKVFSFLLKPIDNEEVTDIISRASYESFERRTVSIPEENNFSYVQSYLFKEFLRGNISAEQDIAKIRDLLNLGSHDDFYQAAICPYQDSASELKRYLEQAHFNINLLKIDSEGIFIIRNPETDVSIPIYRYKQKAGLTVFAGHKYRGYTGIQRSYREAVKLFLNLKSQLYQDGHNSQVTETINLLEFFLTMGNKTKCEEIVDDLFDHHLSHTMDKSKTTALATRISARITDILPEIGFPAQNLLPDPSQTLTEYTLSLKTQKEIIDFLVSLVQNVCRYVSDHHEQSESRGFIRIKHYVEKNFREPDLSLGKLASLFDFNPSYISRSFTRNTGCTFKQYLTRLRIEKAVDLLSSSDEPAYSIAEKVGFPESHYFSTCFKKQLGISISDFRKQYVNRRE